MAPPPFVYEVTLGDRIRHLVSPLTPEEVFAYFREDNWLTFAAQRFVVTPDLVGRGLERRFSPTGPSANALRYCTMPPEYTLVARGEIAAASLMAHLCAGNHWLSLAAEYCWDAVPVTSMGELEREYLEQREAGVS